MFVARFVDVFIVPIFFSDHDLNGECLWQGLWMHCFHYANLFFAGVISIVFSGHGVNCEVFVARFVDALL